MKIELTEWAGGDMPVEEGTQVIVLHRDGDCYYCKAGVEDGYAENWKWDVGGDHPGDIMAYAVVEVVFNGKKLKLEV